jgi:hypothetical protein
MDHEEFEELLSSIKAHGQREPITLYQDKILDGWHRYRACQQLGVSPITTEFKGDDPVAFVIDLNLNRRHLSPSQKALAVVSCNAWRSVGKPLIPPRGVISDQKSAKDMAKSAGVGERTVQRAKEVVTKGDKETVEKVKKGALTLSEALKALDKADPSNTPPKPVEPRLPAAISVERYQEQFKQHEALKALHQEQFKQHEALKDLYQEQQDNAEELAKEVEILESLRDSEHYPHMRAMQATIDNLTRSRDKWQAECAEMKKQVLYWRKRVAR